VHAPLNLSKNNKGAVLLYVLLLLMVAVGLVVITLSTARRNVVQSAVLEEKSLLESRVEASVELIVLDLIEHGQHSRWLNPPGNHGKLTLDGTDVEVSVIDVRGLVDVNSSDLAPLEQLLSNRLGAGAAAQAIERLRDGRAGTVGRWGSYADMAAALGLSIEQISCLQSDMTLFSRLEQPDARYAPEELKGLLRLHGSPQQSSVMGEENVVYGQTYKIIATTSGPLILSSDLVAELLLTGKTDLPHVLRSWMWVPDVDEGHCKNQTTSK